tara:strand:- start:264 stop:368 length:105 start_codon:yes stop_codon:yes gene_type:complete
VIQKLKMTRMVMVVEKQVVDGKQMVVVVAEMEMN